MFVVGRLRTAAAGVTAAVTLAAALFSTLVLGTAMTSWARGPHPLPRIRSWMSRAEETFVKGPVAKSPSPGSLETG